MSTADAAEWLTTTLGAICEVNPPKPRLSGLADDSDTMFVPMSAVDEVSGEIVDPEYRPLGEVRNKSYRTFAPNDVLFAKITPCMENGKCAVVPDFDGGLGFGSTEFHVLRPNLGIDPRFIWHYLRQRAFRRLAEGHMTGSVGQQRVPAGFMRDTRVRIPRAEQQQAVVAAIDSTTNGLHSSAAHLTVARRAMVQLRLAALSAASAGRFADGRVAMVPLGEVVSSLDQGWSPRCESRAASPDEWGVIKTTAVQGMTFAADENKALPTTLEPRPDLELRDGDLLVTRAGPRSRVGISCLVREPRSRLMICDKVYRLRADEARIVPEYLELVLNAPSVALVLDEMKTGTSESGMNLTQKKFLAMELALPPLEAQCRTVNRAKALTQAVEGVQAGVEMAERTVEDIGESAVAKAFRGELLVQPDVK